MQVCDSRLSNHLLRKLKLVMTDNSRSAEGDAAPRKPYWGRSGFESRREAVISWCIFGIWLGGCLAAACYHEVWRDEMRALSMAIAPEHLWQLPAMLKNEGHPILWYLVLRWSYQLTGTTLVLKVCGFAAGALGIAIWWRKAPFAVWLKLLFMCSGMAVYSCLVMSRNYGIGLIFLFAFAAAYRDARVPLWGRALALGLLMNCNATAFLLGLTLAVYWLTELVWTKRKELPWRQLMPAVMILVAGAALAVWVAKPDQASNVSSGIHRSLGQMASDLVTFALNPGAHYDQLLAGVPAWLSTILLYGTLLLFVRRRLALVAGAAGVLGLTAFFGWIYPGHLRHEGMVLCFILSLWWISSERDERDKTAGNWRRLGERAGLVALLAILLIQVNVARLLVYQDVRYPMSSAQNVAAFLDRYPMLNGAVLLCDPAYLVETIPYYRPQQRIFMPREGRYQKFSRFTHEAKTVLSVEEFLQDGKRLAHQEGVPVLFLLGHPDMLRDPSGQSDIGYVQSFTWTEAGREDFLQSTSYVQTFIGTITGEDYAMFVLKPEEKSK